MFYDVEDLKTDEIFLKLYKTCEAQPEKRWLPAYYFEICLPDGTKAGTCELRVGHNEKTYIGGNIGYAGCTYIVTADIPEDNEMYAEGKRQVRIYRFDL